MHKSELRASNVPKEIFDKVLKELAKKVAKTASNKVKSILYLPNVQNVTIKPLNNGKKVIIRGQTLVIDRSYAKKVVTSTLNNLAKQWRPVNNSSTNPRKPKAANVFYIGLPTNKNRNSGCSRRVNHVLA
jgi:hypothetical protein